MVTLGLPGKGIKTMAEIHQRGHESKQLIRGNGVQDNYLLDTLTSSFLRFERSDVFKLRNSLVPLNDILTSDEQVRLLFKSTNTRKASGPDKICGRTLHHCAEQLPGVFTDPFQMCVDSCIFPSVWKSSNIIPILKFSHPRDLQDFMPSLIFKK